jgi:hypothetical protein
MDILVKLASGAVGGFDVGLVTLGTLVALVWQCLGLAWSRQWFLMPLAVGLAALGAFLLNPLADSTSLVDLQSALSSGDLPLLICSLQILIAGVSVWMAIKSTAEPNEERWRIGVGALHCLPSPLLIVGVLTLQQQWLSLEVGARPEGVGLLVALSLAGLLVLMVGAGIVLSPLIRTKLYLLASLMLMALAALMTALGRALPSSTNATDWQQKFVEIGVATAFVAIFLLVGYGIEAKRCRTGGSLVLAKRDIA